MDIALVFRLIIVLAAVNVQNLIAIDELRMTSGLRSGHCKRSRHQ